MLLSIFVEPICRKSVTLSISHGKSVLTLVFLAPPIASILARKVYLDLYQAISSNTATYPFFSD